MCGYHACGHALYLRACDYLACVSRSLPDLFLGCHSSSGIVGEGQQCRDLNTGQHRDLQVETEKSSSCDIFVAVYFAPSQLPL